MIQHTCDREALEEHLDRLRGRDFISENTLDFFRDIFTAQEDIKKMLDDVFFSGLATIDIQKKLSSGQHILSPDILKADPASITNLFRSLCGIIDKHGAADNAAVHTIIEAEKNAVLDPAELIAKLAQQDGEYFQNLSSAAGVDVDLLMFCTFHCARPFYEAAAEKIVLPEESDDDIVWMKKCCPACGSVSQISTLDKAAGKRHLFCLLCGTGWRFMRLKCSYCNSELAEGMKFLAEEKGPWRIDVCEKCSHYLKTHDGKKSVGTSEEFIPKVEDVATLYLDMFAEKEGYCKSWFFPPDDGRYPAHEPPQTAH